jgi:hypothetical protein
MLRLDIAGHLAAIILESFLPITCDTRAKVVINDTRRHNLHKETTTVAMAPDSNMLEKGLSTDRLIRISFKRDNRSRLVRISRIGSAR